MQLSLKKCLAAKFPNNDKMDQHCLNPTLSIFLSTPSSMAWTLRFHERDPCIPLTKKRFLKLYCSYIEIKIIMQKRVSSRQFQCLQEVEIQNTKIDLGTQIPVKL